MADTDYVEEGLAKAALQKIDKSLGNGVYGPVANEAARLAFNSPILRIGDIVKQATDRTSYKLNALPATDAANWGAVGLYEETNPMITAVDPDLDVLVYIVLGQSNAEGIPSVITGGTPFAGPAPDVKVMGNDAFSFKDYDLIDNNVYRKTRTNTVNPATEMARHYQSVKDADASLPEMRIMNISLSGSGIHPATASNRWNPDYVGGENGLIIDRWKLAEEGNIDLTTSLYDTAVQAIGAGIREIEGEGKRPVLIGCFIAGFESETQTPVSANHYKNNLTAILDLFSEITGTVQAPLFITKLRAEDETLYPAANIVIANTLLDDFAAENAGVVIIDPADSGLTLFGAGEDKHYLAPVQEWFAQQIIAQTVTASQFGHVCRIRNSGAGGPSPDEIITLDKICYTLPPTAVTNGNLGTAFVDGPANVLQTANIGGVTVTISGDQAGAAMDARADGIMLPDASGAIANGVVAQAVNYTITFSPAIKTVTLEARDFVLLSGRERRMTNFNIAPQSVSGALDLTAGVIKGTANGGDGTITFDPAEEISTLTFTVEGEGTNGLKGPRLRFLNAETVPETLNGLKILRNGVEEDISAAGETLTGHTPETCFIDQVDDITSLDPNLLAEAWQTGTSGSGAGKYHSIEVAGVRVWLKA